MDCRKNRNCKGTIRLTSRQDVPKNNSTVYLHKHQQYANLPDKCVFICIYCSQYYGPRCFPLLVMAFFKQLFATRFAQEQNLRRLVCTVPRDLRIQHLAENLATNTCFSTTGRFFTPDGDGFLLMPKKYVLALTKMIFYTWQRTIPTPPVSQA